MSWYDDVIDELARARQGELDPARKELALWSLLKGQQRAEARTRRHTIGLELIVSIDGDVRHSLAFRPAELELLKASSETLRLSFEADGWEAAGPHRIR
jgi:hypothetical protein